MRHEPGWEWALAACVLMVAVEARADVSAQDRAAARSMFDSARELVKTGKYAEACPKFEESQRLDPGIGTQFNLADCYEHVGRTASAWSVFLEAASQARLAAQADREKASRERAEALSLRLVRLSIAVPPDSQVSGLEVRRDGTVVGTPMWGQGVPVDPGGHSVEASAPGRMTWKTAVEVRDEGKTVTLTVPVLEKAAATVLPSAAPVPTPDKSAAAGPVAPSAALDKPFLSRKGVGAVIGGVGLVGLGIAGVFAMQSKSKLNDAKAYCNGNTCWDQRGVDMHGEAVSAADMATVFSIVGGVAFVSGLVVYLTAPPSSAPARNERPRIVAGPGTLSLQGTW
jgi:hypothetical protein